MDPRQARSQRSRERVLAATRACIEEDGIDGLTIAAVAARAQVAVGTVYTRFRDREDLLRASVEDWTAEVTAALWHDGGQDGARAGEALADHVRAVVAFFRRHRAFIRQTVVHAPLVPGIAAVTRPWLQEGERRLAAEIRAHRGDLPDAHATVLAGMVVAHLERSAVFGVDDAAWDRAAEALPALCAGPGLP